MRLVVLALLVAPALARAEPIDLVCKGTALTTESSRTVATVEGDGGSASGAATTYRKARSTEVMRVRLDGNGGGQLKLPASLIPPISKGRDGWWDFVKLEVSDDVIRGQVSLNPLNKPKVTIDRRTGDIDMKGLGMTFQGGCEKTPEAAERKF